jgi:SAM-dependent methyltransferase
VVGDSARDGGARDPAAQRAVNAALWSRDLVSHYVSSDLRPVESDVLREHAELLRGRRLLELGCGAGRLTGYLAALSSDVVALDVSAAMLEACKRAFPSVHTVLGDMADLSGFADGEFFGVVAGANVIDVFDHDTRLAVLRDLRRITAPGGLLVLSSHNLGAAAPAALRVSLLAHGRRRVLTSLLKLPRWWATQHRLRRLEYRADGHAVLNDLSHDYQALHYYVSRDAMAAQLQATGWDLESCRDLDGGEVKSGEAAAQCLELHYLARPTPSTSASSADAPVAAP